MRIASALTAPIRAAVALNTAKTAPRLRTARQQRLKGTIRPGRSGRRARGVNHMS